MAQKYDLTDIGNALSRVMDNPMTKIIRSGSIGVLGVVNPVAGIVGGIGNDLLSEYNTFKLGHLLNGLASGFNLERRLNELYNYVNSSPEKAIIVANLFKQTVNAECRRGRADAAPSAISSSSTLPFSWVAVTLVGMVQAAVWP